MATDFLLDAGTNGFKVSPLSLISTELNGLANGGSAISSVGGSSGVFNQSSIASCPQGELWAGVGGAITPSAGGYLAGWWLRSSDGGTTFEATVTASTTAAPVARTPDFLVPLNNAATSAGQLFYVQGGFVLLPWSSFRACLWNMSGATLPASGNAIKLGPTALQY